MIEKLKSAGTVFAGLLLFVGLILIVGLLIGGAGWVSEKLFPWFAAISGIAFVVLIVVLLPLSAIRGTRSFAAISILCLSYFFGVTLWMHGLLTTLTYWGTWGVVIGLCFAGVGVVPVGVLAALFHANWPTLFQLILMTIITFGSRFFALWLGEKVDLEE